MHTVHILETGKLYFIWSKVIFKKWVEFLSFSYNLPFICLCIKNNLIMTLIMAQIFILWCRLRYRLRYLLRLIWGSLCSLSHRLQVRRNIELTSGCLDYIIDSEAFADFGQGHSCVLVDLENSLRTK